MHIPSPPISGFHIGPVEIHFYALMYLAGIALAIWITRRRWRATGGNPDLVGDVALWGVPAGIIGGRIYFDVTTPMDIPHVWYGPFAVWSGGLGIWGAIALAAVVGAWRVRRAGASVAVFMDAVAPALLVAQAVGRIGNYFNQELFGKPTTLPWAVEISRAARISGGIPAADLRFSTFQPSFLYELIFDLLLAAALVWLGHHQRIRPPGLFALYVAGYSGYRIFEETIRIDSSKYILGMRLNFWIALIVTLAGLAWFAWTQRHRIRARDMAKGAALLLAAGSVCAATGCGQSPRPATPAPHAGASMRAPRAAAVESGPPLSADAGHSGPAGKRE